MLNLIVAQRVAWPASRSKVFDPECLPVATARGG